MKKTQFKRQNTITLNIYESQNNINHLLSELESHHLNNSNREIAYVQANITDLMGKFQDSQTDLRGDLMDVLESFQKGTMSADELQSLLQGEKERGSLSLKLVEEIQSNLEDVIAFVAHFVHDVEQGKPLPKQSFKSLFQELDLVSDTVNSISKVVRTPSRKVREMRTKIGTEVELRQEKSRGIGGTPAIVSFVQSKKNEEQKNVPRKRDDDNNQRYGMSNNNNNGNINANNGINNNNNNELMSTEKISSNKIQMPNLYDRSNTPNKIRRGMSFRSMSRSPSRDMSEDDEKDLGLQGKKSNLSNHRGMSRQKSGRNPKGSSVRSLPRDDSDDELSYDSSQEAAIRDITSSKKTVKCHRQTQTDDIIPEVPPLDVHQAITHPHPTKKGTDNSRPRLPSVNQSSTTSKDQQGNIEKHLASQILAANGHTNISTLQKHGSTFFKIIPNGPNSTVVMSDVKLDSSLQSNHDDESTTTTSSNFQFPLPQPKKPIVEVAEQINFGETVDYESANAKAKQLEEEEKARGEPDAIERYLVLKDKRLNQLEMSLKKKESNLAIVVEQQVKVKVEEVRMEMSDKIEKVKAAAVKTAIANITQNEKSDKNKNNTNDSSIKKLETQSKSITDSKLTKQNSKTAIPSKSSTNTTGDDSSHSNSHTSNNQQSNNNNLSNNINNNSNNNNTITNKSKGRLSEAKIGLTLKKDEFQKIVKTILAFLPKDPLPASISLDSLNQPQNNNNQQQHHHQTQQPVHHIYSRNRNSVHLKDYDSVPTEIHFSTPQLQTQGGTLSLVGTSERERDNKVQRKDRPSLTSEDGRIKLPQIQPSSLSSHNNPPNHLNYSKNDEHYPSIAQELASLKMIGTHVNSHLENSSLDNNNNSNNNNNNGEKRVRSRGGGSRGGWANTNMSDDESTFTFNLDRSDRALNGTSDDRTRTIVSEINEIWVPPPSSLARKKLPTTIVIFPLHTIDSSTSTDDLVFDGPLNSPLHITFEPSITNLESSNSHRSIGNNNVNNNTNNMNNILINLNIEKLQTDLATSSSPLTLLYQQFFPYLSVLSRHHLMAAAAGELADMSKEIDSTAPPKSSTAIYSTSRFANLFEVVLEEISKLEYTSYHALESVPYCEQMISDLVILSQSGRPVDAEFLAALREVTRLIGELEIAEAWVDMLLTNSRTLFNRIRILSIHPAILGENYQKAYQAFLACQGTNVDLKQQLIGLQKTIQTYLQKPLVKLQEDHSSANRKLVNQMNKLIKYCKELEDLIGDRNDELDELRDQLILMDKEKDRTPGALLFYSALSNPKFVDIITNHTQSLNQIKDMINGQDHYDFIQLKRLLESSFVGVGPIQQFIKKYQALYKKWSLTRTKLFVDRKLIGADADSFFICPLCSHDTRNEEKISTSLSTPINSSSTPSLSPLGDLGMNLVGKTGIRKGTAMRGVSRGMIHSRSLNTPLSENFNK